MNDPVDEAVEQLMADYPTMVRLATGQIQGLALRPEELRELLTNAYLRGTLYGKDDARSQNDVGTKVTNIYKSPQGEVKTRDA